ncbi:MAG: hypothetical protein JKY48_04695 [Flavobacteriales bacterium]|nr:hypothetical protein [Flavobacteriales bacterium]
MKHLLAVFAFLICLSSFVQAQLARDVFPFTREYKNGGIYFSPQATISFGNKKEGVLNLGVDSSYRHETTGRGKWGYGLEVGWYHTFKKSRLLDFVEGGVAFRFFQGAAEHKGNYVVNQQSIATITSDNTFKNRMGVATLRAVKVKQLRSHSFLSFAVGVNYNYSFGQSLKRSENYPNQHETSLDKSNLQAHLQFGYGFRLNKQLLMIPTLETPIVSVLPSSKFDPAFPFFGANYHPLIIGLKFMLIRKDPVNCNAPVLR